MQTIEMSVYQLLRSSLKGRERDVEPFDLIYCGGLFDYLSANVARQLVSLFARLARPGGLVLVANMDDARPFRYSTEYLLDWHLIYRDSRDMAALNMAADIDSHVTIEPAMVNLFLELRLEPAGPRA